MRSALARSAIAMMKCFPVVSCHGSCSTSTTGSGGYDGLLLEVSSGANWSIAHVSNTRTPHHAHPNMSKYTL